MATLLIIGPNQDINYYQLKFDCRVSPSKEDPDILQTLLLETQDDRQGFAKHPHRKTIIPEDQALYGQQILMVDECSSTISSSWDRGRINCGIRIK